MVEETVGKETEEETFFKAGVGKDNQGLDIALPAKQNLAEATAEAEELINQEDLVKAAEKLAEVEEMINQAEPQTAPEQ